MPLKRLLNRSEENVNDRLRAVCDPYEVHVYPKVRLSDVLPIEGSGISDQEYSFALRAHLDFVIVDKTFTPLFAVEFDGPLHKGERQKHRDRLKNTLSKRFGLPLIRIDSQFITELYSDMDLLTWLVGVVLERKRMVADHQMSPEERAVLDPILCAPFVISYQSERKVRGTGRSWYL